MFDYFIAHLIGDYLLQNDWMAVNKKKFSFHCFIHVFLYMIPFYFLPLKWYSLLIIAIQHFVVDRTNIIKKIMAWQGREDFIKPPFGPWSIIVTDNISHILTIWLVVKFVN